MLVLTELELPSNVLPFYSHASSMHEKSTFKELCERKKNPEALWSAEKCLVTQQLLEID